MRPAVNELFFLHLFLILAQYFIRAFIVRGFIISGIDDAIFLILRLASLLVGFELVV
jgi:hypothetical protein